MRDMMGLVELFKTFANLFVVWLVVMGWFHLTDVQQATTLSMVMAGINIIGWIVQRNLVTPVNDPKAVNTEGKLVSLIPEDGSQLPVKG